MKTQQINENFPRVSKLLASFLASLFLTALLTACGGSKSAIVGKWEIVQVGEGGGLATVFLFTKGQTIEFTKDRTVIFSDMGTAADYSWMDKSRLKIGGGQQSGGSIVFNVTFQDDDLLLNDPNDVLVARLQRYVELTPSPKTLAGVWDNQDFGDNECFALLENNAPGRLSFGEDGSFRASESVDTFLGGEATALEGNYAFHDDHLRIEISGKKKESSLFNGTKETDIAGVIDCAITLTHSSLIFKDDQGNTTLYVRGEP